MSWLRILILTTLKRKASRLRDWNRTQRSGNPWGVWSWNEKHLDYEIETRYWPSHARPPGWDSWNEKHLDYEIETETGVCGSCCQEGSLETKSISITRLKQGKVPRRPDGCRRNLKRKASRLRDWNWKHSKQSGAFMPSLKRKASRLRDWNKPVG